MFIYDPFQASPIFGIVEKTVIDSYAKGSTPLMDIDVLKTHNSDFIVKGKLGDQTSSTGESSIKIQMPK